MAHPKNILIVAGEPSGDLHASNLVKNLRSLDPGLQFFGIGGRLSKAAGVDIIFDISALALIGYVEVLKNLATVGKAYKSALEAVDAGKPEAAILIDYPGFNLRLAGELKKRGIPVIYYISPQVWAWGPDRINIIKRCVKKMVVFFKFEEELYKRHGIDAEFVGHPLLDTVKAVSSKDEVLRKYGIGSGARLVALLPGSRQLEVKKFLPIMARASLLIKKMMPQAQFIVTKHPDLSKELYESALKNSGEGIKVAEGNVYDIVGSSDFAIVASGTATLETTIIGTPYLIVYKVNPLTYLLYNIVSRTKQIGLANIIAGGVIVPELLQFNMTPEKIAAKAVEILSDSNKETRMRHELAAVRSMLGNPGASMRAALTILPLL